MKRTLWTLMFLATFAVALAGPPVDYQLFCGTGDEAQLVGVASLVEDELHVALIEGALELSDCVEVFGVRDGEPVFTVTTTAEGDLQVVFDADPEYLPTLTYDEVPAVAVEGMLGAQENRAMAFQRATQARERAPEHAGGPPMVVPDGEEEEGEAEDGDGPPADLPAPATHGRP